MGYGKTKTSDSDETKYFHATYELRKGSYVNKVKNKRDSYLKKLLDSKKMRDSGEYVNNPLEGLSILSISNSKKQKKL